jgi:hypothetical protein
MDVVKKTMEIKNSSIVLKGAEEKPEKIKPFDIRQYAGSIKKFRDGLEYQRKIRSDWENGK